MNYTYSEMNNFRKTGKKELRRTPLRQYHISIRKKQELELKQLRVVLGAIINHRTVAISVAKIVVKINFFQKYKTPQAPWGPQHERVPWARAERGGKKTTLKTTKKESCRDTAERGCGRGRRRRQGNERGVRS